MQLVEMKADLVAKYWPIIKEAIRNSVPPMVQSREEVITSILKAILEGRLTCWGALEGDRATTILTTAQMLEGISQTKLLWIYSIYAFEIMEREYYSELIHQLKRYAQSAGCTKIITYSCNPDLLNIFESLGSDTTFRYVTIHV